MRFNSILVQLEGYLSLCYTQTRYTFQFHIGAIRSNAFKIVDFTLSRFNSILVQLEDAPRAAEWNWRARFNSILVQLEGDTMTEIG